MSIFVIFIIGYAIGGISALLLVGLTLVSRRERRSNTAMERMSYEIEHSAW